MTRDLAAITVGAPTPLGGPVTLAPYDAAWPALYAAEADKIGAALGHGALALHHVGSTSVPGLSAKPILDILLVVADSAHETGYVTPLQAAGYVTPLQAAGYVLRIREPDWFQHRLLRGARPDVNLHVFSAGCPEIGRMLTFRDRLRADDADRALYEAAKRDLAARTWAFTQDYADAKSGIVEAIMARALTRG